VRMSYSRPNTRERKGNPAQLRPQGKLRLAKQHKYPPTQTAGQDVIRHRLWFLTAPFNPGKSRCRAMLATKDFLPQ